MLHLWLQVHRWSSLPAPGRGDLGPVSGVARLQGGQERLQAFALHPFLGKMSSHSVWWDPWGLEGKGGRFISQGRGHGPLKPLMKCLLYQKCVTKELWPLDLLYIVLVKQVDLAAHIDLSGTQFICIYWALSCLQLDICNTKLNISVQTYFVSMCMSSPHEVMEKKNKLPLIFDTFFLWITWLEEAGIISSASLLQPHCKVTVPMKS